MASSENFNICQTKYDHTEKIMDRRKALFPSDDADSDLGHMSPLHSNSNSNSSNINALESHIPLSDRPFFGFNKSNIDDYIIFEKNDETLIDYICSTPSSVKNITDANMSPLYLSPMHKLMSSPILYSSHQTIIPLTPIGKSPTSKLQTPHDTSTLKMNCKQPKRKFLDTDLVIDDSENEDKTLSPDSKSSKLDNSLNKSKVRTALFPENNITITLPTKSFYPKENQRLERSHHDLIKQTKKSKNIAPPLYLCNRRMKTRNRFGQINAGVRHKIKKPKQKKETKASFIKAALNIMEKSKLNEYIEKVAHIKTTFIPKQIKPIHEENKENMSDNRENIIVKPFKNDIINKKFFKSSRPHGVVTINKNIKLDVEKGKIQLLENKTITRKRKLDLDATDLNVPEEFIDINISSILSSLDDSGIQMDVSQNKILCPLMKADLILSPTSQMCDMASVLAINSPKRAKLNINALLDDSYKNSVYNDSSVDMEQKLFPIFYGESKNTETQTKIKGTAKTTNTKKFKILAEDQMILDAGQKRFGVTECHECNSVYTMGDPSEELMHLNFHNGVNILKLNGWKYENVVHESLEGRIIKISPGDSKAWWKKVKDVMEFINRDLGFYETSLHEQSQIYFYIKNKQIIGCLVADPKDTAYKLLSSNGVDMCSIETYPIKCGVSRIWVSPNNRKQGIATIMMNTLCSNFMFGNILSITDIALSSPTDSGKLFASKYFKNEHFYIYF